MTRRDLPEVVKATFGVGSPLSVKLLTSDTLLQEKHSTYWPIPYSTFAPQKAHSILRFASQNYYLKSRIPEPDPSRSGGLGQQ
jgi:hypothetical protein